MPKTNIEKVEDFMNYTALGQVFVIDAITRLANAVVENEEKLRYEWPTNHIIAPEAWVRTAQEWLDQQQKG